MTVRAFNKNTLPDQIAQRLAELTAEVAELSHRLQTLEGTQSVSARAQQTEPTLIVHDHDKNSIQLLTENGFVIVRPWETNGALAPREGAFRFRVQDPQGNERDITVGISQRLMRETALRTRGRIEPANQFWICCAERRLANYLMEHDEYPKANEMTIATLDREDILLAIRWEKSS